MLVQHCTELLWTTKPFFAPKLLGTCRRPREQTEYPAKGGQNKHQYSQDDVAIGNTETAQQSIFIDSMSRKHAKKKSLLGWK